MLETKRPSDAVMVPLTWSADDGALVQIPTAHEAVMTILLLVSVVALVRKKRD